MRSGLPVRLLTANPLGNREHSLSIAGCLLIAALLLAAHASAFEGRITAASTQGGQTTALLYTVGTSALRIEVTGSETGPIRWTCWI